jgi:hypothetical protein
MVALGDPGTLAQLYANLTSDPASNAWPKFQSAIQALPNRVTSDDPFGGAKPVQISRVTGAKPPAAAAKAAKPTAICQPKSKRLLPPNKKVA